MVIITGAVSREEFLQCACPACEMEHLEGGGDRAVCDSSHPLGLDSLSSRRWVLSWEAESGAVP